MDDIIQRIIDIEQKAQVIVNEARDERRAYEQTMGAEIEAFREGVTRKNKERIDAYAARMKRDTDENVRRIEDAALKKADQMREIAAANKAEWVDRLYKKMTAGEL